MIILVLPAFNEEANVSRLLGDIARTLGELLPASNVTAIVVDDGSSDLTAKTAENSVRQLKSEHPRFTCNIVRHDENKGLAEALKTGMLCACELAADQDIIVTMDCDNTHTPGLISLLARRVYEGYDVVIASRFRSEARVVGLTFWRQFLSWGASLLLRSLFPISGVRDYTCGFRAYRASVLKEVVAQNPSLISETGFSVMVDVLLKVHRHDPKLAFGEVPILLRYDWKEGASKMKVARTIRQTLSLAWRRRCGDWV